MDIVLSQISKSYHSRPVLEDLNLEVSPGEFHVLLGPSGGGKTTLVSIIAGLTKPDMGSVLIRGRDVSRLPPGKRETGLVFQDSTLFPHLDVFDNIAYGLRVRKHGKAKIAQKLKSYLEKTGLEKEQHKFPHQLSGGQKQRVALLRTLVTEPEILLLDEPMSSLDALTKEQMGRELETIQQETGITMVYVTHNQEEAFTLGDRVSVLHDGKIEQIESPEELFYHPKTEFVARFVGIKNILKGYVTATSRDEAEVKVENKGLHKPFKLRVKKYPLLEKGTKIDFCIHPDKISLQKENAHDGMLPNRLPGKILHLTNHGFTVKATVEIGGALWYATLPQNHPDFKAREKIWACFSLDAPHPLCGRNFRAPDGCRRCQQ